jgi:hypothetical protein
MDISWIIAGFRGYASDTWTSIGTLPSACHQNLNFSENADLLELAEDKFLDGLINHFIDLWIDYSIDRCFFR